MDNVTLLTTQLTDVFRIGLLMALLYTAERNRAQTGFALPIAAGVIFIAVMIASVTPIADISLARNITSGLVANTAIMAVLLAALSGYKSSQK